MKTVVPDDFPPVYAAHAAQLDPLRERGEVVVHQTRAASPAELSERLHGAAFAINVRAYSVFDEPLLATLPDLRLISVQGTGTDNVDLAACTRRGVVVTNCPGAAATSVAELAIGLLLAVARGIAASDRLVRAGTWAHPPSFELRGKVLGIVGLGLIGQEVARLGRAFGMRVVAWSFRDDPARAASVGAETMPLADLLREADVVSIHLRNSSEARGLIGAAQLALMKPSAVLINTARGAIVDEAALLTALRERLIAGAGLDVFVQEPVPAGSAWAEMDNVVLSPHAGGVTAEASARLARLPVDNILAYLAGRPANVVNPTALTHPRHDGLVRA